MGDVVTFVDENRIKDLFKLGKVSQVMAGQDGLVRRVQVKYRVLGERSFRYTERCPSKISLLVPIDEQI